MTILLFLDIVLRNLKQKAGEDVRYAFLLKEKIQLLNAEILRTNEMLQSVTNLTPVEFNSKPDNNKILVCINDTSLYPS